MYYLKDTSLEWALIHLTNYYDSDFYPKLFEFEAVKFNWQAIKTHMLGIDVEKHAPQNPVITLAPKPNGNFRVVHQLDPIDSIIYTALLYENAKLIEDFRIIESRNTACSYRINPDLNGSFFGRDSLGYQNFLDRAEELSNHYSLGYTIVCDIADFYNQIYLHRVNNILSEAGSEANNAIENFLSVLNTNTSRGIPVGPAPSILISEAIMADIDKKILLTTTSFTRYADDIYIFFNEHIDAYKFLHELTNYLHNTHRLVLSSEKTKIIQSNLFVEKYLNSEIRIEKQTVLEKLEELASEYSSPDEIDFEALENDEKLKIRSEVYGDLLYKSVIPNVIDLGLLRHILRQSGKYRIKSIIPLIFKYINKLFPVIREIVIYFDRILSPQIVKQYEAEFQELLLNRNLEIEFINIWVFTLFQNNHFNAGTIKIDYQKIIRLREKALIARREKNTTWLKDMKGKIDTFGPWDKRAILYASSIISKDELIHWLGLEQSKGDMLTKSTCSMVISQKKNSSK